MRESLCVKPLDLANGPALRAFPCSFSHVSCRGGHVNEFGP